MKKIVLVTSQPETDEGLLASLNKLFPECEVQVVLRNVVTSEQSQADSLSGPSITEMIVRA